MRLGEATWTDAAAVDTELAVLPVGSTEQHGPHAPLATDTLNAVAVAEAGAASYEGEVVIAPALPYGISAEHRRFAGTCWLGPDTFRAVVEEVVGSLATHGWRRVVVVNGHGGNVDALREIAGELSRAGEAFVVPFTWFAHVGEDGDRMGHAGPLETALLRAHHPDLVREDRVADAAAGAADGWGERVGEVTVAHDVARFSANGVVGDPREGTAALGETLTERAAASLADLLESTAAYDLDAA